MARKKSWTIDKTALKKSALELGGFFIYIE
jgi:hypothetical protein